MTYTRYKPDDWVRLTDGVLSANAIGGNVGVYLNDTIWFPSVLNSLPGGSGRTSLQGISSHDGSQINTILIKPESVYGTIGIPTYDIQIDQNNYLWCYGSTGTVSGNPNFIVTDTVNSTVVTTIGNAGLATYGSSALTFDNVNNLMWAVKNSTTVGAISTISYSETKTIAFTSAKCLRIDTDKNELWITKSSNTSISIYNPTTSTLITTVTTTFSNGGTFVKYIPEKKVMIVSDGFYIHEIWSTETYTKVLTINTSSTGVFRGFNYSPNTEEVFGYFYEDATGIETLRFFSITTGEQTLVFDQDLAQLIAPDSGAIVDNKGNIFFGLQDNSIYKIAFNIDGCYQPTDPSLYTGQSDVFNREIVFDLDLGAFFVNDFGYTDSAVRINDYVSLPMYTQSNPDTNVLVGNDHVIITSGEEVVVPGYEAVSRVYNPRGERFKYLATSATGVSLVEYRDFSFRDYVSMDGGGFPFASYLLTGYDLSGDMMKKKRSIYLIVYCERTEKTYTLTEDGVVLSVQSGCIVQSQWEWANSAATGKWGRPFQAYRLLRPQPSNPQAGDILDYGERVIVTKNKLRGSGRSLSLFIQAECSKDLKLLGWGLDMTRQDFV